MSLQITTINDLKSTDKLSINYGNDKKDTNFKRQY